MTIEQTLNDLNDDMNILRQRRQRTASSADGASHAVTGIDRRIASLEAIRNQLRGEQQKIAEWERQLQLVDAGYRAAVKPAAQAVASASARSTALDALLEAEFSLTSAVLLGEVQTVDADLANRRQALSAAEADLALKQQAARIAYQSLEEFARAVPSLAAAANRASQELEPTLDAAEAALGGEDPVSALLQQATVKRGVARLTGALAQSSGKLSGNFDVSAPVASPAGLQVAFATLRGSYETALAALETSFDALHAAEESLRDLETTRAQVIEDRIAAIPQPLPALRAAPQPGELMRASGAAIHRSETPLLIAADVPNTGRSTIQVDGASGTLRAVRVAIDLRHTFTRDLVLTLVSPKGKEIKLVDGLGGSGDDFRGTVFDDSATESILNGAPPFVGTFRPQVGLSTLEGDEPNGTWALVVADAANLDGGVLNSWQLELELTSFVYRSETPHDISPSGLSVIRSSIPINDVGGLVVESLKVEVDIRHTYVGDLMLRLKGPENPEGIILVARAGGSGNDFKNTVFSDSAPRPVQTAAAPFRGEFKPVEALAAFKGSMLAGEWLLEVEDQAELDGGTVLSWGLIVETRSAQRPQGSQFKIDLRFGGGLSANQRSVFELAAARWSRVIIGDLPTFQVDGENVDDLLIYAEGADLGGPGGVLGQAGPEQLRPAAPGASVGLPVTGVMSFDKADLDSMEQDGTLVEVILHEMGHVLGIGTLWNSLSQGIGGSNPTFRGANAMREYGKMLGGAPAPVPIEAGGGPGTAFGHWRESTFHTELMTGWIGTAQNPLSAVTVGALKDLGYQVDEAAADAFTLPNPAVLAARGLRQLRSGRRSCTMLGVPRKTLHPKAAVTKPAVKEG